MPAKQSQLEFTISDVYEASGKTLFTTNIKIGGEDIRIDNLNPSYLEELLCAVLIQTYGQAHPIQLHWYDDDSSVMHEWKIASQDGYKATNNDPLLVTLSVEEGDTMRQLFQEAVYLKTISSTLADAGAHLALHPGLPNRTQVRLNLLSKTLSTQTMS